jgi:hypothetical protein
MVMCLAGCHFTTGGLRLPSICQLSRWLSRPIRDNPGFSGARFGTGELAHLIDQGWTPIAAARTATAIRAVAIDLESGFPEPTRPAPHQPRCSSESR